MKPVDILNSSSPVHSCLWGPESVDEQVTNLFIGPFLEDSPTNEGSPCLPGYHFTEDYKEFPAVTDMSSPEAPCKWLDDLEVANTTTPTGDEFGSMFSKPNPCLSPGPSFLVANTTTPTGHEFGSMFSKPNPCLSPGPSFLNASYNDLATTSPAFNNMKTYWTDTDALGASSYDGDASFLYL
eukprot:TRINITY_DN17664_c0_g3_i2.p1 TRINITY_DN17664_c0_g3~~TRINITY_DN17664_c0_g3_i2.p1  ORF type:complete len:182 (-),score=26.96 TRINITY_DN17664_c0_g3_i2:88-633(-)